MRRKKIRLATANDYKGKDDAGLLTEMVRKSFFHGIGSHDSRFKNTIYAEKVFAYLYRRFGPPKPGDTYNDLFHYEFVVGRTLFMIWGSTGDFVNIQAFIPKKRLKAWRDRNTPQAVASCEWLVNTLMDAGLPPWSIDLHGHQMEPGTAKRWSVMFRNFMVEDIGEDATTRLYAAKNTDEAATEEIKAFKSRLYAKYEAQINDVVEKAGGNSAKPRNPFFEIPNRPNKTINEIEEWLATEMPETWEDLQSFIWQMRRPTYVRDVYFNIAGREVADDSPEFDAKRLALMDDVVFGFCGIQMLLKDLRESVDKGDMDGAKWYVGLMEALMSSLSKPDASKREVCNKFASPDVDYWES